MINSASDATSVSALTCYIITYNRLAFLEQTLNSFANSTCKDFRLVIIDNGGSDPFETESLVGRLNVGFSITLMRFEINQSYFSAFFSAATESESEFLMIFHDDDLLHPDYIHAALSELNTVSDCAFVCSYGKSTPNPKHSDFSSVVFSGEKLRIKNSKHLAVHCIADNQGVYGSTVYRRSKLRNVDPSRITRFGKIHDRPVWFEVLQGSTAVFFKDQYVLYRVHEGQDTVTSESGPYPEECIALLDFYRGILGESLSDKFGRTFNFHQLTFLREMWKWPGIRSRLSFLRLVLKAFAAGVANPLVFVPRVFMRFLRKRIVREDIGV
jgi:glycosyltransferase involved in cell wall biosynthesis